MGQLPHVRVTFPTSAFQHCGLDYAGPMHIRPIAGRGISSHKAYIAIFVCMATRAVHLEIVDGYSTPAFLGAYSRFCARRGLSASIYSDNGTTFVGADRELKAAFRPALRDPNFLNRTVSDYVLWHFIPPAAPHFGGLWEAGVRSVKHHLRRVVGTHTLTFEEFATLLNENRLSRWQVVRQITERFWKLWQTDYVNTLQQRVKWRKAEKEQIKVGRLVLLRNPLLPPCKWELGRIIQCDAGADDIVRVVTIKTATSEYKRPVVKICLLPIDVEDADRAN
ncbi:uncharacterized protein [Temnothorax longispinosus]|uniref:uncharacterized protein n=1 Tax=Temnothorax longispinosus TaxID=300112 RepID=UPI003A99494E